VISPRRTDGLALGVNEGRYDAGADDGDVVCMTP
jgi:hypothetical protein